MPFSLEGFAFFTEAIFLGIYLYGWDRISPRAHLWAGVMVAVSGAASGIFVVIANAWMNTPTGFDLVDGRGRQRRSDRRHAQPDGVPADAAHDARRPTPRPGSRSPGSTRSCCSSTRTNAFHRRALAVALLVGAPAAVLQPISGDLSARAVAEYQPAKLAAMEAQFETGRRAPLRDRRLARHGDRRRPGTPSRFPAGSRSSRSTTSTPR